MIDTTGNLAVGEEHGWSVVVKLNADDYNILLLQPSDGYGQLVVHSGITASDESISAFGKLEATARRVFLADLNIHLDLLAIEYKVDADDNNLRAIVAFQLFDDEITRSALYHAVMRVRSALDIFESMAQKLQCMEDSDDNT